MSKEQVVSDCRRPPGVYFGDASDSTVLQGRGWASQNGIIAENKERQISQYTQQF